jgi:hypothetical protein
MSLPIDVHKNRLISVDDMDAEKTDEGTAG